jgi:hypothetical protein
MIVGSCVFAALLCIHSITLSLESQSEKAARGALFTVMRRQLALDTVLIIDAMNYIKGFRYQMYCAAREMKLRFCTVRYTFFAYHRLHSKICSSGLRSSQPRTLQRTKQYSHRWSQIYPRNVRPKSVLWSSADFLGKSGESLGQI